jgi:hypothetical protein
MGIETALTLLSLLSFAALIVVWIAAPLHAEEPTQVTASQPASQPTVSETPVHSVAA